MRSPQPCIQWRRSTHVTCFGGPSTCMGHMGRLDHREDGASGDSVLFSSCSSHLAWLFVGDQLACVDESLSRRWVGCVGPCLLSASDDVQLLLGGYLDLLTRRAPVHARTSTDAVLALATRNDANHLRNHFGVPTRLKRAPLNTCTEPPM